MYRIILRCAMLAAVALASFALPAFANEYQAGAIKISRPWTRLPPAAAKVAGGYMTLTNTGTVPDRLIGGTVVTAARFEIHEMSVNDGVMRMRQLDRGLEIKPGETVVLKPGSFHVMFLDVTTAPEAGNKVKGTLVFEKGGTVEVEYKVEAAGATSSGQHSHGAPAAGSHSGAGSHATH